MTKQRRINQSLVDSNLQALLEGSQLLKILEPNQYTQGFKPAFQSTIGAHFRHVLEHYRCFIKQIDSGIFCYDSREREHLLECDADLAAKTIEELGALLSHISEEHFARAYNLVDEQSPGPVATTLQRELLFLQSHTMHHYAIIAAMARAFGNQPDKNFGVAIATRTHQKCQEIAASQESRNTTVEGRA